MRNQDLILKICLNIRLKIDIQKTQVSILTPMYPVIIVHMMRTIRLKRRIMRSNSSTFVCRVHAGLKKYRTQKNFQAPWGGITLNI